MITLLALVPIAAVGIGVAAGYGVTHRERRIHFVEPDNLNDEIDEFDIEVGHAERCVECGRELDPEDVGAVVRVDSTYKLVCDKPTCLDTYDLEQSP